MTDPDLTLHFTLMDPHLKYCAFRSLSVILFIILFIQVQQYYFIFYECPSPYMVP